MTGMDSTMLGEVIVRVTRKWVFDATGTDLTPDMVEMLLRRIDQAIGPTSVVDLLDVCSDCETEPATRELLHLLACEDPVGRPFDRPYRLAGDDCSSMAVGLIARLMAARYGYEESVEREAIRMRLKDDPQYAHFLVMETLDVIEWVLELQYASDARRKEALR